MYRRPSINKVPAPSVQWRLTAYWHSFFGLAFKSFLKLFSLIYKEIVDCDVALCVFAHKLLSLLVLDIDILLQFLCHQLCESVSGHDIKFL